MKKIFSKLELIKGRGCYNTERINELFPTEKEISIQEILSVESVNIKDKRWFVYNSCELTLDEKKELCIILAYIVLPIYEEKYANDLRVRECLDAIQLFKDGKITLVELKEKRDAAAYADAAADAAYAAYAADAAYAASYAAYAASYAASAYASYASASSASYAAAAAAYASSAAASLPTYSEKIKLALISFFE